MIASSDSASSAQPNTDSPRLTDFLTCARDDERRGRTTVNRSPVSTSPFRQVQPAKRARLLLVRPNVNSGLCAMAKYGEINSGSWVVNGEERLEVCVVVYILAPLRHYVTRPGSD